MGLMGWDGMEGRKEGRKEGDVDLFGCIYGGRLCLCFLIFDFFF